LLVSLLGQFLVGSPNFKGSEKAAELLSILLEFKKAEVVKVNPDSPQRKVR